MSTALIQQHCRPLEGQPPMAAEAIAEHLRQLQGWAVADQAISKTWRFADFHHTIGFVNAVAFIANREDHHPDLSVGYGHCTVRFSTHSVGGLSINDFICAALLDALLPAGQ